jgi:sulfite exporter TauE/SafE
MLSTETLFFLYLSTGFTVGFGHCIGMCGPIVISMSLNLKDESIIVPQFLYNLGRITTYAVLGGAMGATGTFVMVAANIEAIQKGVMIFAGIFIVIMGAAMGGWLSFATAFGNSTSLGGFISRGFRKLLNVKSTIVYLPSGLLLGLLPCGPVYTALLGAARTGMEAKSTYMGTLAGMGLMVAFGVGTVPALFLVAKLADMDWLKSREMIYKAGSIIMIIVGILFIIKAVRY